MILDDIHMSDDHAERILRRLHKPEAHPGDVAVCTRDGYTWPCSIIQALDSIEDHKLGASERS